MNGREKNTIIVLYWVSAIYPESAIYARTSAIV